jgi:Subtilase family
MKKLLFSSFLILSFSITIDAQDYKVHPNAIACIVVKNNPNNPNEKGTKICYRKHQIVFWRTDQTFSSPPAPGTHLINGCACQNALELWEGEGAAELIPDGGEVKDPPTGKTIGFAFKNILAEDDYLKREPPSSMTITDRFPQPTSPSKEVKVVIVDSGVNADYSTLMPHLPISAWFTDRIFPTPLCDKTGVAESIYGMNVIDTRFEITGTDPPHVQEKFLYFEPRDMDGHGTFINGIVAGTAAREIHSTPVETFEYLQNNLPNIALRQLNVKFAKSRTEDCALFDGLCGIHYGINKGAKVINVSWRVNSKDNKGAINFFTPTLKKLYESNVLLVAGAGNDTLDLDLRDSVKAWPAALSNPRISAYSGNVITVGAWEIKKNSPVDSRLDISKGNIAYFSNYGESIVNIYAPGIDILGIGLDNGNKAVVGQGTSYAAPFITRIAGLLMGAYSEKKPSDIKKMIIDNAISKDKITVTSHSGIVRELKNVKILDYTKLLGSDSH